MKDILSAIEARVRERLAVNHDGHDWDHTLRVYQNARRILARLQESGALCDVFVVEAAALLHDVARPEESAQRGGCDHAVLGAEMAPEILRECGCIDEGKIQQIAACIRSHRYRKREGVLPPESLEARILFDADKLDSIGAIGIGRAFHFAGHIGARVHNTAQEALGNDSYSHEDSAYREYLVKLRHIPQAMLTEPGRQMALHRAQVMEEFFEELNLETRGE